MELDRKIKSKLQFVRNKTIIGLKFYLNPTSLYHKPVRNKTIIGLKS